MCTMIIKSFSHRYMPPSHFPSQWRLAVDHSGSVRGLIKGEPRVSLSFWHPQIRTGGCTQSDWPVYITAVQLSLHSDTELLSYLCVYVSKKRACRDMYEKKHSNVLVLIPVQMKNKASVHHSMKCCSLFGLQSHLCVFLLPVGIHADELCFSL